MKVNSREIILKDGKRVILRSPLSSDAENLLKHLRITHTESYKNLNQPFQYWDTISVADEEKILADFDASKNKFMLGAFFDGRIVGGLGFVGAMAEFLRKNASIGMSIQRAFCNSGLGTEMMKCALALGKEFGFHRVDLTVRTYNSAGISLYEKVGFKRIGLLKETAYIDGEYVDEYAYQIILD
jgi:RimJ/RimL family protein N-acetyltransferase